MSRTTKSATEFAKIAYDAPCHAFPDFSGPFGPKKFTRPQIVTMLALDSSSSSTIAARPNASAN
jgi:hypothetical protein